MELNSFSEFINEKEKANSIEALAKESGKSTDEVEKEWSKAAGMAASEGKGSNFAYVLSIVKGLLKI